MDKEMQREIGLFNGLPAWWKKKQMQYGKQARLNMEGQSDGLGGSVPDDHPRLGGYAFIRVGHGWLTNVTGFGGSFSGHGNANSNANPGPIAPPRKYK